MELKLVAASGLHRAQRPQRLYSEVARAIAQSGLEILELDTGISQEFLGRGSLLAINASAPCGALSLGQEE